MISKEKQDAAAIHWDGKILKICGVASERCCVFEIKFEETDTRTEIMSSLGVPEIPNGRGGEQEKVVISLIQDWGVVESIVALLFDTTSANTGVDKGPAHQYFHL